MIRGQASLAGLVVFDQEFATTDEAWYGLGSLREEQEQQWWPYATEYTDTALTLWQKQKIGDVDGTDALGWTWTYRVVMEREEVPVPTYRLNLKEGHTYGVLSVDDEHVVVKVTRQGSSMVVEAMTGPIDFSAATLAARDLNEM